MKPGPFASVEEYMAAIENLDFQAALQDLRNLIREELPEAEEKISYGMPAYKINGYICFFAAFSKHCSFFPGAILDSYEAELVGYKTSRGTVQFTPRKPINPDLVRRMIRHSKDFDSAKKQREKS